MNDSLGPLTAIYRDGRVHIGGKSYAAGTFTVHLLNQYYKNDTVARIAIFRQHNWNVQEQFAAGYLHETDFLKAGEEILTILKTLPKLKPFSSLDIAAEKQRISELFAQENAAAIQDYFCRRTAVAQQDQGAISLRILPPEYDKLFLESVKHCAQLSCRSCDSMMPSRRTCAEPLRSSGNLFPV